MSRISAAKDLAAELDRLGGRLIGYYVEQARAQGYSWTEIGAHLGVSRQAAQQRYTPLRATLTFADLIQAGSLSRLTRRAQDALVRTESYARELGQAAVLPCHLLLAVLDDNASIAIQALTRLGADPAALRTVAQAASPGSSTHLASPGSSAVRASPGSSAHPAPPVPSARAPGQAAAQGGATGFSATSGAADGTGSADAAAEAAGEAGPPDPPEALPLNAATRRVLEAAVVEALRLGHNYIGTEHMLLGLLHDQPTAEILGIGLTQAREAVRDILAEYLERMG